MQRLTTVPAALIALTACLWLWYVVHGFQASEAAWKAMANVALIGVIIVLVAVLNLYITPFGANLLSTREETGHRTQGEQWSVISGHLGEQARLATDPKVKHFFAMRALAYELAACEADPERSGCSRLHRRLNSYRFSDSDRSEVRGDAAEIERESGK